MAHNPLLGPIVALVAWTIIMLFIGASRTISAAKTADLKGVPKAARARDLEGHIPLEATWGRQNYEHLVEQPTLFYAIVLALVAMGDHFALNLYLAWAYVVLRIIHSIVQLLGKGRFLPFILSTLALIGLTLHAGIALLHG
ncbi:MAPEG family protein [Sphingomonas jaspsi]|uniref:MAPEG family protein n=1 Tax=Sphingomonas jaspsi TaxID=392409 RepID=UPI0004AEE133|nr:MAPEG family protein [Sphingomonas jaspsi]